MSRRHKLSKATLSQNAARMGGKVVSLTGDRGLPGSQPGTPEAYARAWSGGMFAPGQPVLPNITDEDTAPRQFDYAAGINLYYTPRGGYSLLPFTTLRQFADLCEEIRIVVEAVKRETRALTWDIVPENQDDDRDYTVEKARLREWWRYPDGQTEFDAWQNALLEDMLVCDALTVYIEGSGDGLRALAMDGTLIRPLLDYRGMTPMPPVPAYMQYVKGRNWQWFTTNRLLYRPFNTSTGSPYGKSAIEFFILRVNEAIRRKMSAAQYWDQTNIPEMLAGLPDTWTTQQIEDFQNYWDALLTGDIDKLRRMKFMPTHGGQLPVYEVRRPGDTAQQDEWMLRLACWCFGFLPSELGLVAGKGLGGAGFMEGQENAQYRFGFGPMIQFLQNLYTTITRRLTGAPLCWRFTSIEPAKGQAAAFDLQQKKLYNGVIDINVMRQAEGQEPIPDAQPFIVIGNQVILLKDLFAPKPPLQQVPPPISSSGQQLADQKPDQGATAEPPPSRQVLDAVVPAEHASVVKLALADWQQKVLRRVKDGKSHVCDPTALAKAVLPASLVASVKHQLEHVTRDRAAEVFGGFLASVPQGTLQKVSGRQPERRRHEIETRLCSAIEQTFTALATELDTHIGSVEQVKALTSPAAQFWHEFKTKLSNVLVEHMGPAMQHAIAEVRDGTHGVGFAKVAGAPTVGVVWDVLNQNALNWARDYAATAVTAMAETTQQDIRDALAGWIESGDAFPDLVKAINEIVDDKTRAEAIAATEATRAFAEGNTLAWKAQGVEGRRWYTATDERVCDICAGLHGQVAAMDEPFESDDGEEIDNPPGHVRCRCYIQPVEKMDAEDLPDGLAAPSALEPETPDADRGSGSNPEPFKLGSVSGDIETDLRNLERENGLAAREAIYVFDTDGNPIVSNVGTPANVTLSSDDWIQTAGNLVTHNHPGPGGSFSDTDVFTMIRNAIGELHASDHAGIYRLVIGDNVTESLVAQTIRDVRDEAEMIAYIQMIESGELTEAEAEAQFSRRLWPLVMRELRRQGYQFDYEAEMGK